MIELRIPVRMATAVALAWLLSACWVSERPLLTDETSTVISFAGDYRSAGDGATRLEIVASGGNSYLTTDGKDPIPTRFLALRGSWYLMQYQASDDSEKEQVFLYNLLDASDGELRIHGVECEDTKGEFEGMTRDDGACRFSALAGLKAAALAQIAGLESGSLTAEPSVFERAP